MTDTKRNLWQWTIGAGILFVVLLFTAFLVGKNSTSSTLTNAPQIQAQKNINKSFTFPARDANGNPVTQFQYSLLSTDFQNDIIIRGQPAHAVSGKTFFIVNIKITNSSKDAIQLNTRDYLRISLGSSKELLAADIHNDPVQIQSISTKYTSLGFPVDASVKKIVLYIGEITGPKTTIPLDFSKN